MNHQETAQEIIKAVGEQTTSTRCTTVLPVFALS